MALPQNVHGVPLFTHCHRLVQEGSVRNVVPSYYGPSMNAFEATEKNSKSSELQSELEELFEGLNHNITSSILATFLKVLFRYGII